MFAGRRLGIALLACACASAPAHAHPALWVAHSPTATVYLFGTMHVLPKNTGWRFPALVNAVIASQALYVEEDDETRAKTASLILRYGVAPQNRPNVESLLNFKSAYTDQIFMRAPPVRLTDELDAHDRARLRTITARSGKVDRTLIQTLKPWLAALTLANTSVHDAGYAPRFGADAELEREFSAQHKPVHSFETAQEQVALFAGAPQSTQLDLLRATLGDDPGHYVGIAQITREWLDGDSAGIAAALDDGMRANHPGLYKALVVERNHDFAQRIATLLQQHGTFFVALGAAHLAGADSVRAQLAQFGIPTTRVRAAAVPRRGGGVH